MFERIDIRMDAPICNCCNGNYNAAKMQWGIWLDDKCQASLYVRCEVCKTELKVANKKFIARFIFGNPPPDGSKDPVEEKETPKDLVGNVIQLKTG